MRKNVKVVCIDIHYIFQTIKTTAVNIVTEIRRTNLSFRLCSDCPMVCSLSKHKHCGSVSLRVVQNMTLGGPVRSLEKGATLPGILHAKVNCHNLLTHITFFFV